MKENTMQTAKLFKNGRSQAVRLPTNCRFSGTDVYVKKYEGIVLLIPKDDHWTTLINSLDQFTEDYMDSRSQPVDQLRISLD